MSDHADPLLRMGQPGTEPDAGVDTGKMMHKFDKRRRYAYICISLPFVLAVGCGITNKNDKNI